MGVGTVSWDGADLVQCLNNLSTWIGSWVGLSWCHSAALCLTGGRISEVFYFWDRCALKVLFFLVWGIVVSIVSIDFAVSPAVVLAAKFRADFNIQHFVIYAYL